MLSLHQDANPEFLNKAGKCGELLGSLKRCFSGLCSFGAGGVLQPPLSVMVRDSQRDIEKTNKKMTLLRDQDCKVRVGLASLTRSFFGMSLTYTPHLCLFLLLVTDPEAHCFKIRK